MKQTTSDLVFIVITGSLLLTIAKVTGQRFLPSPSRNCEQYRGSRGQIEITGNDDSVYCLNQDLYQSALTSSPTDVANTYINDLLKKALTRCFVKASQSGHSTTEKKKCRSRKCKKMRYHGRRRKRYARKNISPRKRRYNAKPDCGWERKEVRMLSKSEWDKFTNRINILKKPIDLPGGGSFIPYDVISDVHRPKINLKSAHDGPNFLGWHRVYLLILEAAIGVPTPYWDSRLDYDMDEPIDSVLWTDRFFGPGIGKVDSGPFANWITAHREPLARNIGLAGSLISECMVERVLRYTSHDPVVNPTVRSYSIEDIHKGPHRWVNKQLATIKKAPQDPVFFLHHAFVDYMWQLFRQKMRDTGNINPATDYPDKGSKHHGRLERMTPFNHLKNMHGYGDFIESLSSYEPAPRCPSCGRSEFLECDKHINRCKSKAGRTAASLQEIQQRRRQAMNIVIRGKKFENPITDIRTSGVALSFLQLGKKPQVP